MIDDSLGHIFRKLNRRFIRQKKKCYTHIADLQVTLL